MGVAGSCSTPPPPKPVTQTWPTIAWPVSTPEAQGMSSQALAEALLGLRTRNIPVHSLLIARNGYLVLDAYFFPYTDREPHDVASITKSVTSMLVGIAMDEHAPIALDEPVSRLFAQEDVGDPRTANITLAELLDQTSGFDCSADASGRSLLADMEASPHWSQYALTRRLVADPGSRFNYCAANLHLVSAALSSATGKNAAELAREALFTPLGIAPASWPADPDGVSHGFADLELKPRDLAKLGLLWLKNGEWDGRQIVPADYLKSALTEQTMVQPGIAYGYGMWLYPGHTPYDFEANGRGGQRIAVVPSLNAVVVTTGGGMNANDVTSMLGAAFKSDKPLPSDADGSRQLQDALHEISQAPAAQAPLPLPAFADTLAGQTWWLGPNPLRIRTIAFQFPTAEEGAMHIGFADGTSENHAIGLDGVSRLSPNLASGLNVAVTGSWTNGGLDVDYDEVARINDYRFHFAPAPGGLTVRLTERTGLVNLILAARAETVQDIASSQSHDLSRASSAAPTPPTDKPPITAARRTLNSIFQPSDVSR